MTDTTTAPLSEAFLQAQSLDDWIRVRRMLGQANDSRSELIELLDSAGGTGKTPHRAMALWMLGRYREAAKELKTHLKSDKDGAVHMIAGSCLRESGDLDEAGKMFDAAADAGEPRGHVAQAELLLQAGDDKEATARLKKAGKGGEKTAEYWYVKGLLADHEGDRATATEHYDQALEIDDSHPGALFRKAYHLDSRGDDDAALEIYESLRWIIPVHVNTLINLGLIYEDREQYPRAITCYEQVLDGYPNHERARLFLKDAVASLDMHIDEDEKKQEDKLQQLLKTPVTEFELSVRSRNCLSRMKIDTLGDLVQKSEQELLSYKNFGETSLQEIKSILNKKGLRLGMKPGEQPAPVPQQEKPLQRDEILKKPIAEINFSVRVRKVMERLNIHTLGDLTRTKESDLTKLKNFGKTSLSELKRKLAEYNMSLASE